MQHNTVLVRWFRTLFIWSGSPPGIGRPACGPDFQVLAVPGQKVGVPLQILHGGITHVQKVLIANIFIHTAARTLYQLFVTLGSIPEPDLPPGFSGPVLLLFLSRVESGEVEIEFLVLLPRPFDPNADREGALLEQIQCLHIFDGGAPR